MKTLLTPGRTLATSLLLGLGVGAAAQSLGPVRGEAWIGRPLEVTVPASFAPGEARDDCVRADVFFGDQRVHRVRTSVVGAGAQHRVRIETDAAIDEPVVTVSLRAGCGSTMVRSYTLLPDLPAESPVALAARSAPAGGTLSTALAAPPQPLALQATRSAGAPPARVLPAALQQRPAARPKPAPAARIVRAQEAGPTRAVLKMENWEPDPQTMLRVSSFLGDPQGDAARRATAAMLWQALNADPSELLRTAAALQKLEGELADLRRISGQTRAEMLALRSRLEAPQPLLASSRTVEILALLLLLAGGTAAFVWHRGRRAAPREWSGAPVDSMFDAEPHVREVVSPSSLQPLAPSPAANFRAATGAAAPEPAAERAGTPADRRNPAAPRNAAPAVVEPRIDLALDGQGGAAGAVPARPPRAETSTVLRVETLAATFEEVEFLASLGLWNDAIEVLKTYLEDSSAPAPLAFFELMRLCVLTDDAASLVSVRKRYAQVFGKEAPKFDQINAPLGLEGFPELAGRITRSWGQPEALDFIELSLFTVPLPSQAFSLQAGRDLLFLHDLAMTMLRGGTPQAFDPGRSGVHDLAPWAHAENPAQARIAAQKAAEPTGGHHFALDLDLGVQAEELPDSQPADLAEEQLLAQFEAARAAQQPKKPVVDDEDAFSAAVSGERLRNRP